MEIAVVTAVVALVTGLVSAAVSGWLATRAKVSEDLRDLRRTVYPPVWKATSLVSRHPETTASYADLMRLHLDLRRWYYGLGGIALSKNARDRYMELQTLIGTHLARDAGEGETALHPDTYDSVRELASAFRTGMTDDLESRRQRSLVWSFGRWRDHRGMKRKAAKLQAKAETKQKGEVEKKQEKKDAKPELRAIRHDLTEDDLRFDEPEPPEGWTKPG
jgi:hypothetical protein